MCRKKNRHIPKEMKPLLAQLALDKGVISELRQDLKPRGNNDDDILEVYVWTFEDVLYEAYKMGMEDAKDGGNQDEN